MDTQVLDHPAAAIAPVDVVRAAYAAYNRGGFDERRRYLAPDVELHADVLHGPDAVVRELESELDASVPSTSSPCGTGSSSGPRSWLRKRTSDAQLYGRFPLPLAKDGQVVYDDRRWVVFAVRPTRRPPPGT
jgi:hypothetical protein